jgi:(1->4)-alpha-D-glucan 1-alpha-D-glucosylmutase
VGSDLKPIAIVPAAFHALMQHRASDWPNAMTASATHDTKRGEDTRARMHVLSEVPDKWSDHLRRLEEQVRPILRELDGAEVPSPDERYLLYQTLAATWPTEEPNDSGWMEYAQRIRQYMEKAMREAKLNTSWINPSDEYEAAALDFIAELLDRSRSPDAIARICEFAASIADAGFVISLSQLVLKACVPGLPDFYQGTELWDFNLVDPDNRRPINYAPRRRWLAEITAEFDEDPSSLAERLASSWPDPRIKQFVTWRLLQMRRERYDIMTFGQYMPLEVEGKHAEHAISFARTWKEKSTVVVVPRLVHRLLQAAPRKSLGANIIDQIDWADTAVVLPESAGKRWINLFTNGLLELGDARTVPLRELLRPLPVGVFSTTT